MNEPLQVACVTPIGFSQGNVNSSIQWRTRVAGGERDSRGRPLLQLSRCWSRVADTGPLCARIDKELFVNLCAHLTLAAENSRNYVGAITDPLTGLRNKRYGIARLEELWDSARRNAEELSVVMLDIDHFKAINDTYGHPFGDEALKEVARRIVDSTRRSDIHIRYGGEEFLVILPNTTAAALHGVAEKLRRDIAQTPVTVLGNVNVSLTVSVSVGAAYSCRDISTIDALISAADEALYCAKEAGRNEVRLYDAANPRGISVKT